MVALTKKARAKGRKETRKQQRGDTFPMSPVDTSKACIAFCLLICPEQGTGVIQVKLGHVGIRCHHSSTDTANNHQKHLHDQFHFPSFNNTMISVCRLFVIYLLYRKEKRLLSSFTALNNVYTAPVTWESADGGEVHTQPSS